MSVLVIHALMYGGCSIYMTLKAVASKNYWMGVAGSLMFFWTGLCLGKMIWG